MVEVGPRLIVGDLNACRARIGADAVVHACKHPCHQRSVGYTGNLPASHPEYLVAQREHDLYANLVDMDRPLDHRFTGPIMAAALDFIEGHDRAGRPVLVHCNEGRSRAPTVAMLYLAKRAGALPDDHLEAAEEFRQRYPAYAPGPGVRAYLARHWHDIN